MDAHFDPNTYHPTFGTESNHEYNLFDDVLLTTRSFFHQMSHEYSLPDDVVEKAVHDACEFLHIKDMEIRDGMITGVYVNDPSTLSDDVFSFNRQNMLDKGVHDERTLSLLCTHEATHRLLNNLSSTHYYTNWQTELTCDAFMGVRASVQDLSLDQVERTLRDTKASETHPNGDLRLRYLGIGKEIGKYLTDHNIPVTYDNIMQRLETYLEKDTNLILHQEVVVHEVAAEHRRSENPLDTGELKGYTREEINRNISKAKLEMAREEANMRHWKHMTNSRFEMGEPNSVEASAYKSAHDRYIKARDDVWKWEHTHAEVPKCFMDLDENAVDVDTFYKYASETDVTNRKKEMDQCLKDYGDKDPRYIRAKKAYDFAKNSHEAGEKEKPKREADMNAVNKIINDTNNQMLNDALKNL